MVIQLQLNTVEELQAIQRLACEVPEDVYLHSLDDSVMVDAKSFINLFTLDFSKPIKVVTESEKVYKALTKE